MGGFVMTINKMIYAAVLCLVVAACGGLSVDLSADSGDAHVEQYSPPQHKVGQKWTYTHNYTHFDGQTGSYVDGPYQIVEVSPDNSFVAQFYNERLYYKAGNQYHGWINSANDGAQCWWEQDPKTIFPLFVGKKVKGTTTETCREPGQPDQTAIYAYSMEVLGEETLTIAGKQIKTIKTAESMEVTQALDSKAGDQVGDRLTGTRWWSPELGIYVKIAARYTSANHLDSDVKDDVQEISDYSGFSISPCLKETDFETVFYCMRDGWVRRENSDK